MLINIVEPEWFVPVHGEYTHMVHHARLAEQVGVPRDHVIICEDGDKLTLEPRRDGTSSLEVERRGCPRGTSTSTASSATSGWVCCAIGATSPRRASSR